MDLGIELQYENRVSVLYLFYFSNKKGGGGELSGVRYRFNVLERSVNNTC